MMYLHNVVGGPALALDWLAYLLGLMTLPTLFTVLVLVAYWRRERLGRRIPDILGGDDDAAS